MPSAKKDLETFRFGVFTAPGLRQSANIGLNLNCGIRVESSRPRGESIASPVLAARNAEYLLYQTSVGAWPIECKRVRTYMKKVSEAIERLELLEPAPVY